MDAISDIDRGARPQPAADASDDVLDLMDKLAAQPTDEIFFELDDAPVRTAMDEAAFSRAARTFESLPESERASMAAKPAPRKVNPYEISDGGVNLEEDRPDI